MNDVTQRLVTFNTYFYGFAVLDRQSFFGDPPSGIETFVMALVLALTVTLVSPIVARWIDRSSGTVRGRREVDRMARHTMKPDLGF